MYYTWIESPVGALMLAGTDDGLERLAFGAGGKGAFRTEQIDPAWVRNDVAFAAARRQLDEYFAGTRQVFDLPLRPRGTPFQRAVLEALRGIPYGETRSYRDIATAIGNPRAVRAVGLANGANPLAIVIPCHRVIGSDGSLTGFGGGLDNKRYLLGLEAQQSRLFA